MKKLIAGLVILLTVCFAVVAYAADATDGVTQVVTGTIQPFINAVVTSLIGLAILWLTKLLKDKLGLEVSASTQEQLKNVAFDAVAAVEEKAAKSAIVTGQKWASESKHSEAINLILAKVPTLTKEEADQLVNSALCLFRGLGATKDIGN